MDANTKIKLSKPAAQMSHEDWKNELVKYYMQFDIADLQKVFDIDEE